MRGVLIAVGLTFTLSAPALAEDLGADPAGKCASLASARAGAMHVDKAEIVEAKPLAVLDKAATPASRIVPATPTYCRVFGRFDPVDAQAPPVLFEVNLPVEWNGRALQYGGGGFNGVLITGLGLPPAMPFDAPAPLARGFVTSGTDSGHESKPGEPPQLFALNDEAFLNFSHLAYKKTHDATLALIKLAYGRAPDKVYFMGSSEGGREALTMAERYPDDFDGIFARVPVIGWTGLQHAGTRDGIATMGSGWLGPKQVKLVADAVVAQCGGPDGIVLDAVGCKAKFDPAKLACASGGGSDDCLTPEQIAAVNMLHSPYRFSFPLANGMTEYPGWGVSGEAIPASGPTGGWDAWWLGASPPAMPPKPDNGIAWVFGAGGMAFVFARDPHLDVTKYRPEDHQERVREVSALMDSTNPDLSAFKAHGGKLIMLEHLSDYAQSPFMGIAYYESVRAKMGGEATDAFLRLYTAPGVDHVGSGAPANVDMLAALTNWVEKGVAPENLEVVEQPVAAPFAPLRSLPLCPWPAWPHYNGGDAKSAASYACKS